MWYYNNVTSFFPARVGGRMGRNLQTLATNIFPFISTRRAIPVLSLCPPLKSDDRCEKVDAVATIGCIGCPLVSFAAPIWPIAAGVLLTVPAFPDSPPSSVKWHHAPQKPTITLSPFTALSSSFSAYPWKDLTA